MLPRALRNSSRKASCSGSRRLNFESSKCPSTAVPQEVHCSRTTSKSELQTGHFPGACGIGHHLSPDLAPDRAPLAAPLSEPRKPRAISLAHGFIDMLLTQTLGGEVVVHDIHLSLSNT